LRPGGRLRALPGGARYPDTARNFKVCGLSCFFISVQLALPPATLGLILGTKHRLRVFPTKTFLLLLGIGKIFKGSTRANVVNMPN
jgi:hypothetical protein